MTAENELIDRYCNISMDYISRIYDRINAMRQDPEWTDEADKGLTHIIDSRVVVSRFIEGRHTYRNFTARAMTGLVSEIEQNGCTDFFIAFQAYVNVRFSVDELLTVAQRFANAIAPSKGIIMSTDRTNEPYIGSVGDESFMVVGTPELVITPDEIFKVLVNNLWYMPLVALGFSELEPISLLAKEDEPNNVK